MEIHHDRHHQAYVNNLNQALVGYPALAKQPAEDSLTKLARVPESIRTAVRNNGGGHANHSLFWLSLAKSSAGPQGSLKTAIGKSFSSRSTLGEKLRSGGLSVFGSGWVWVVPGPSNTITVETSPNQDSPWLAGRTPLFGIDGWEHAYYLKYQNRRFDYLAAIMNILNWEYLSERYENLAKQNRR